LPNLRPSILPVKLHKRVGEAPKGLDGLERRRMLMGMKQVLVMMVVLTLSVMADEVVFKDRAISDELAEMMKKPWGKVFPLPKFTKAELSTVTYLNLSFSEVTDEGLKDVAKLEKLKLLYLIDTKITDTGLKEVAKLKNLNYLLLNDTKITDTGIKEVAKMKKLEKLYLEKTQITDAGLKELAKMQQLRALRLHGTKVTAAGLAELQKALPNCDIYGP